ncbi:hypothetical protein BDR07DRAFT_1416399 [Suillus spraguei]|nr:hypothetical protein BDR07DRAFT_1416399 [Suillus spraguei]
MTITMAVGLLSLPTELICYILILLNPRDVSHCAMTCNTFLVAVRNSVEIQYKLEIYAQGLISTETATTKSDSISSKMRSFKKLASMWQSDFHANIIFETAVATAIPHALGIPPPIQSVKCGLWWTHLASKKFCVQDCRTNTKLSRTWSENDWLPDFDAFDPLQDLIVIFSSPHSFTVTNAEQDHRIFSVEFRLGSSHCPHPDAVCAYLECKHSFAAPGYYRAVFARQPIIRGDRIFVFYRMGDKNDSSSSGMFIQVINWRKGYAYNHFLCQPHSHVYVVDGQKIVVINSEGAIYLYTLHGLDGPPQCRITYHLPKCLHLRNIHVRGHPSFHGTPAHPELMPSYVPCLESQIMVLIFSLAGQDAILVVNMAIFSDVALHSDMPIEIPWSDWGPRYTCYFPHHISHHISVFGSKMAYALPQDHIPNPGQRLEGLSTEGYFYVHIWDFNKRVIARSEYINDPKSPDLLICKPGPMPGSFGEDILPNHAYTATICHTPFPTRGSSLFLEQDRLTLTWAQQNEISIQVISSVQTEAETTYVVY